MEKIISFPVPRVGDDGACFVTIDDGRIFQVNLPEHIATGQIIIATLDADNMYLEYYHTEGDVGTEYGRAVPKLVVGSAVTEIDDNRQPVGAAVTVGVQPEDLPPSTRENIRNEVLSSAMAVRVLAATKQVLERASALDAEYKVSENVSSAVASAVERAGEIDKEYHISEKATAAGTAAAEKATLAMNKIDNAIRGANATADQEENK